MKIDINKIPDHPNCNLELPCVLQPGEQVCTRDYPPDVAFHPARLARLDYGTPPSLVLFDL